LWTADDEAHYSNVMQHYESHLELSSAAVLTDSGANLAIEPSMVVATAPEASVCSGIPVDDEQHATATAAEHVPSSTHVKTDLNHSIFNSVVRANRAPSSQAHKNKKPKFDFKP
ncbi:MAG: hypothetical protein ACHP65_09640, partial [Legionellales bacterium]